MLSTTSSTQTASTTVTSTCKGGLSAAAVIPTSSAEASSQHKNAAVSSIQSTVNGTSGEPQVASPAVGPKEGKEELKDGNSKRVDADEKEAVSLTPRLIQEYVNAGLLMKEYNLRQNRGTSSPSGSPEKSKEAATTKANSSPEKSKETKRKRPLESEMPPESKKAKLSVAKPPSLSRGNSDVVSEVCRDSTLLSSITAEDRVALPPDGSPSKHDRSKPSMRRKASLQRKKSQSQKRPQLDGLQAASSIGKKTDILLCAFCHQRDGAVNLGFLYGPYRSTPTSDNVSQVQDAQSNKDTGKREEEDHHNELWVHEDCAVWAPGVCLVGGQLIGLKEAATDGDKMVCTCVIIVF